MPHNSDQLLTYVLNMKTICWFPTIIHGTMEGSGSLKTRWLLSKQSPFIMYSSLCEYEEVGGGMQGPSKVTDGFKEVSNGM
jgi:hypothetical protein